ncbi:MAG TPA: cytochrome c maturation protein CcmE [Candidatus Polarisedimenticolaceae bacterium]|nr:cytochrome c maturation protein CcmE [Candidatus Polarisedimenticolaceae bacterium]
MDQKRLKFVVLGAGVLLSMGALLIIGTSKTGGFAYYLTVSEFLGKTERPTEGFRVNGKVQQGSIERQASGQDVRFVVTDGAAALPVAYHGIIPDTFVDGADVVVEGRLAPDGVFQAHTLLAKCPSKYEAAEKKKNTT